MSEILKAHINKFVTVNDEEFEAILSYFQFKRISKKDNLLEEGQICKSNLFVLHGVLRKFFINDKGTEQTTEFAIEQWWMSDTFSFINQSTTEFYIQTVENTELLYIDKVDYEKLLETHPVMEKHFRCIYQKAYAAAQMRIKFLYDYSREELYYHFLKAQPEFLQRVPQYLIASYLNFTPEYLSEIRKKGIS
ncbi:Crp/Fnr family transcriptional regulator [Confluentibacter sediminis]|uniref:Crp/Fnr family transcriptional regulator n=1 Tax=Confluentibacter sediminis TaxID=2219045 RepID=UPI000DAB738D|nr:Crp/Fnr family transcriptional regulator [Confluentibacter sediminis]